MLFARILQLKLEGEAFFNFTDCVALPQFQTNNNAAVLG